MKRAALLTLLCAWFAFGASAVVSRAIFDRLPHLEDEFAYLYQARIFARGETHIETPKPIRAYWQPFLVNDSDRRFGKYTPGWPLLLAPGARLGQPWIVNAWLAMLVVALVYRLGREIYDPATGAVAALLTAISPAALLINGTLMGHTAALFFTTLFVFGLWRVERGRRALLWGAVAGAALGVVLITRPFTAAGIAAPFVAYFAGRVLWRGVRRAWRDRLLLPLAAVAGAALLVGLIWPWFNYRVSGPPGESFPAYLGRFVRGDDDTNLYLRVWDYDKVGFGDDYGRYGHTLEKGWRHTKTDLRCAARDLFGWAAPAPDEVDLAANACGSSGRGYSWLLVPLGLLMGGRRRWTWLLAALPASLVVSYVAYWIGGSLYSARYYYEALTAVILICAVGVTELARLADRLARRAVTGFRPAWAVYGVLGALVAYSLVVFAPARLEPLRGYGRISQANLDEVNRLRREPGRPLVVIMWGVHHWRDVAALMAVTDPYLDSDIVLARDPDQSNLDTLLAQWRDREKLFFVNGEFTYEVPDPGG